MVADRLPDFAMTVTSALKFLFSLQSGSSISNCARRLGVPWVVRNSMVWVRVAGTALTSVIIVIVPSWPNRRNAANRGPLLLFADIDPIRADQRRQPVELDLERGIARPGRRDHHFESLQRNIAIDRQRGGQTEGRDAADRMAGDGFDFSGVQHLGLAAESRLGLLIVEPRIAPSHHQHHLVADPEAERLGDLAGFAAMGHGRFLHRGGGEIELDDLDVRGVPREMVAHRLQTHPSFSSSSIMPEMMSSPLVQKAGSEASSPNGASSSLCRSVPPAFSMSRYLPSNPSIPD